MRYWLALIIGGIFLVGGTWLADRVIVQNVAFTDTLPVWNGCHAFLQRQTPYSEQVTKSTQALIQTHYASGYDPTYDEHRFAYPAHTCLILLPLWVLPYDLAAPLWVFINFMIFTLIGLGYWRGVLQKTPSAWGLLWLTMIALIGWRYSMIVIILAQYVGITLAFWVGAMWAFQHKKETLGALFLVGMTIRPESAVIALAMGGYVLLSRRWRAIGVFSATMMLLWAISTFWIGEWVLVFLNRIGEYSTYNESALTWLPLQAGYLGGAIALIHAFMGVWIGRKGAFWTWGMASVGVLVLLFVPQTNSYTLVYALPALFLSASVPHYLARAGIWVTVLATWAVVPLGNRLLDDQVLMPFLAMLTLGVAFSLWREDKV